MAPTRTRATAPSASGEYSANPTINSVITATKAPEELQIGEEIDNSIYRSPKYPIAIEPIYNKEFIKAHIYDNKIEIVENYYYIKDGIKHKFFKSKEEGSSLFISTYEKTNGSYHWVETKPVTN
jgi:hypothetical protein